MLTMAIYSSILCRSFNSVFSILLLILSSLVLKHATVLTDISVIPLWNVTLQTISKSCRMDSGKIGGKSVITFSSNSVQTCSIRLLASADTGTLIQVPPGIPSDVLLFAERKGELPDCKSRYAVVKYGGGSCTSIFRHPDLQLSLRGNASVEISEKAVNGSVSFCQVSDMNERHFPGVIPCESEEFNHQIACTLPSERICSLEFPANCNATLGHRNVLFRCHGDNVVSNQVSLIIYPPDIITLNLRQQNIIDISENHFHNLDLLKQLILNDNKLTFLHSLVFTNLKYLSYLSLKGNFLVNLHVALFKNLKELTILLLSDNNLKSLELGIFQNLTKLIELYLDNNNLVTFHPDLFRHLKGLTSLILYTNELNYLPLKLLDNTLNLNTLDLRNNYLFEIPKEVLSYVSNLAYLKLSYNEITSVEKDLFTYTRGLVYLTLSVNKLTFIPRELFQEVNKLETLYLTRNAITSLNEDVFKRNSNLTYLSLGENKLKFLPNGLFKSLVNLKQLSLHGNEITSLDKDLFSDNSHLTDLSLSGNELKFLPHGMFKSLINLKQLFLHENEIFSIEKDVFENCTQMTRLDLDKNMLKVLPNGLFKGLVNLKKLYLDWNQFNSLDEDLFIDNSKLTYLQLDGNNLSVVPSKLFQGLKDLNSLELSENELKTLRKNLFHELTNINYILLDRNQLVSLNNEIFQDLPKLRMLTLNKNRLVTLPHNIFSELVNLEALSLSWNNLTHLSRDVFQGLINLEILFLNDNQLDFLDYHIFEHTPKLGFLSLAVNKFTNIPNINNLVNLHNLNLRDNSLTMINKTSFSALRRGELVVSQTEICECYISVNVTCTAVDVRSPYLTCNRLLSDRTLMVMMWLIGLNAIGGNLFVLSRMKTTTQKITVQMILLSNLACADLLMGVYMLLIASADIYFDGYFPMRAENWRSGVTCKIAGTISILSSEASVFFVTLISIDRFINIRFLYTHRKLTKKSSAVTVAVLWLIAITLGIVPSFLAGKHFEFYDNSHVCIGLPLAQIEMYSKTLSKEHSQQEGFKIVKYIADSQSLGKVPGLYFAIALFLGLNFVCYLTIMFCYILIVKTIIQTRKSAGRNSEMKEQMTLTANVAAIVLTDSFCWFPVILLGILVQVGVLTLPPSVFAWCVTFLLPINSAINPYLYTISHLISNYRERSRPNSNS